MTYSHITVFAGPDTSSVRALNWPRVVSRASGNSAHLPAQIRKTVGGHWPLTVSLLRGFRLAGIPYKFNPTTYRDLPRVSGVLAGRKLLHELISNEKSVVLGPNYAISPAQDSEAFLSSQVKRILTPSKWVRDFYVAELPEIASKVQIWQAGVDVEYWRPRKPGIGRRALIYCKGSGRSELQAVEALLGRHNFSWSVLNYGSYTPALFRKRLESSHVVIWLGGSESQCLAQFESWAMNVPSLVWNPSRELRLGLLGGKREIVLDPLKWSPAPYLTRQNGAMWNSIKQLSELLQELIDDPSRYRPRDTVVNDFSLKISAARYADLISRN